MISFIVPAYNEELTLGLCLRSIARAARELGLEHELVVVDDASDDRTAAVAREHGAAVVPVSLRHIAAVRNAGARAARGDVFVFVDADTVLPTNTLRAAMLALDRGAIGGGARVEMDEPGALSVRIGTAMILGALRAMRWAAGCFLFVRRAAFEAVDGFDERFYASEEIHLSRALKSQGKFVIVKPAVISSARKARLFTPWQLAKIFCGFSVRGPRALQNRDGLEIWYDGSLREADTALLARKLAEREASGGKEPPEDGAPKMAGPKKGGPEKAAASSDPRPGPLSSP